MTTSASVSFLTFYIENLRFAIPLDQVERIVNIVEIQLIAKSPEFVCGIINFEGTHIPVIDMFRLFKVSKSEPDLEDHLVIVNTRKLRLALWVSKATDLIHIPSDRILESKSFFVHDQMIKGIVKTEDETALIQDLDVLLTDEEVKKLLALNPTQKKPA